MYLLFIGNGICVGKYCKNDGFCDGSLFIYKCLCLFGFFGINCFKSKLKV